MEYKVSVCPFYKDCVKACRLLFCIVTLKLFLGALLWASLAEMSFLGQIPALF